jgi:heme/copper-type cytochrome/quinol oxidase subunit 2
MSKEKSNKVSKEVFNESEYSFIFGLFHFKGKVKQSKSNRILNTMIGCAIAIVVLLALLLFFIIWNGILPQAIQVLK